MDAYWNLDHTAYKALEKAMREFKETTHTSMGDDKFYHKSIRIPVGPFCTFEFTGPAVKAPPAEEGPLDRRQGLSDRRVWYDPHDRQARRMGLEDRRKEQELAS